MPEPEIRVGLPVPGGRLSQEARDLDAPVLMSANAFIKRWPRAERDRKPFPGFRPPPASMQGLDVALDSAGFVAMSLYNGYQWSVARYYDLVESFDWTWHASMDTCTEPEIARDRDEVMRRLAATAQMYGLCRKEAMIRGVQPPVPIVQGWRPEDYARCLDYMPISDWPDLVGVGSMCRRDLQGLVDVVDRLDRELPRNVGLHLFGIKGAGLDALRDHHRVVSVDSMAWDFQCRRQLQQPTMEDRAAYMRSWFERQVAGPKARKRTPVPSAGQLVDDKGEPADLSEDLLDMVAAGEMPVENVDSYTAQVWRSLDDRTNDTFNEDVEEDGPLIPAPAA